MNRVRVVLVDDHDVIRRGLRQMLESTGNIDVVGEAADGDAAVRAVEQLHPDVVLMDVQLPRLSGIEATRRIVRGAPDIRVLMLSMHGDEQYVTQSLAAGASGYLIKGIDDHDLVSAVLAVHRDELYVGGEPDDHTFATQCPPDALSSRERQVLTGICSGHSDRQVARELGVSISAVEEHRRTLIDKLDLHSTVELLRYAIRHRMVRRSALRH